MNKNLCTPPYYMYYRKRNKVMCYRSVTYSNKSNKEHCSVRQNDKYLHSPTHRQHDCNKNKTTTNTGYKTYNTSDSGIFYLNLDQTGHRIMVQRISYQF